MNCCVLMWTEASSHKHLRLRHHQAESLLTVLLDRDRSFFPSPLSQKDTCGSELSFKVKTQSLQYYPPLKYLGASCNSLGTTISGSTHKPLLVPFKMMAAIAFSPVVVMRTSCCCSQPLYLLLLLLLLELYHSNESHHLRVHVTTQVEKLAQRRNSA